MSFTMLCIKFYVYKTEIWQSSLLARSWLLLHETQERTIWMILASLAEARSSHSLILSSSLQGSQVRSPLQTELFGVMEELSGRRSSCSSASLSFLRKNVSIPWLSHYLEMEVYFLLPRQIWHVPLAHSSLLAHAYTLGTIATGNLQNPCCLTLSPVMPGSAGSPSSSRTPGTSHWFSWEITCLISPGLPFPTQTWPLQWAGKWEAV